MDFILLIVGMDANAYYMARCYHEKYHEKAYLIGKNPIWFTSLSKIVIPSYYPNIWDEKEFLKILDKFYNEHKDKKILLISATENYITMISKNKDKLKDKFFFNYPSSEIIDTVVNKEIFYKTYANNKFITLPKTIYYDCSKNENINMNFDYPIIVKPADVVTYRQIEFTGKNKIYKIEKYEDLTSTISCIKKGGYRGKLIIQEYIPGDDSHLFDCVVYSDKNAKVKRMSFAQIGLQEHTYNLVGNAAVLINGYNQYGNTDKILASLKAFMESIDYTGYAEFDLKYDSRDDKFKVLEINPRQGRSSYYLNTAGCNLVELLVNDLIENDTLKYEYLNKEVLLSFVPKLIVKKYIVNSDYRDKALSMWKNHVNPLEYKNDRNFKRDYTLFRKNLRYYKDYKFGYWKNK